MAIQQAVVAVPARLQSSRLPNKVLAEIGGKPMIQRVLERSREATTVQAVVLCTDSSQLQQLAEQSQPSYEVSLGNVGSFEKRRVQPANPAHRAARHCPRAA